MKYGFVKVCAATPEIKVADVEFNTKNIINAIMASAKCGSEITVFPELCVCGYTCGDLFNQKVLLDSVENALARICEATSGIDTLVFVGAPISSCGRLYNCAVAISGGKILGIVPKTHIPNYGEFYERRYFSPAPEESFYIDICGQQDILVDTHIIFSAANCAEFTVSAEICEDLWSPLSPSIVHAQAGANIIVNLSASDELAGKADFRKNLVKMQSAKLVCGYIYADAGEGESTTDMAFSGHNLICENGTCVAESRLFENGLLYGEIDVELISSERRRMASGYYSDEAQTYSHYSIVGFQAANSQADVLREISKTPFIPQGSEINERAELILTIQSKGLEKRLKHTNAKTAVIGISGGLDSALALLVTCRAFKAIGKPLNDIIAITMPAFGTTDKTKNNSLKLIEAVGATCKIIPVGESVLKHFEDIGHDPEDRNVTYENAQARMRTLVLMDIANDTNGLVIGTGDLSELALGWATYNGDHMSMYGVNASVPKTLVKHLIRYEAEKIGGEAGKVLTDILNTEISPELLPPEKDGSIAQKTEDLVGPYVLHDFFLYYSIRCAFAPDKIYYLAKKAFKGEFDDQTIKKWLKNFFKRFFAQQFKRSCVPDGVKVGSVCLSPRADWRMPSDATAKIWLEIIEKL
ncbi:MAG: NAD(+) synthase [Clostridiales bacterium]|nr:NAD(+) synthase [Clostridiales bacterium]